MRVDIRSSLDSSLAVTAFAQRRFRFALGRFGRRVKSLTVRLMDVNGPRGGIDKRCLVKIRLHAPNRLIVIEEADTDAASAIHWAADRAGRAVARAVDTLRDREPHRGYYRVPDAHDPAASSPVIRHPSE